MSTLADLTTLHLGGPAGSLVEARTEDELLAALTDDAVLIGGGSNLVIGDDGVPGTVILIRTSGVIIEEHGGRAVVEVAAGETWDDLVARCVADGLAGLETLSGIPGSVGATPIQNVGAYGQEVAQTIAAVRVWDRRRDGMRILPPSECGFGYRDSVLKREPGARVVLSVAFALTPSPLSLPIRYAELAGELGVTTGQCAPLAEVREAVLALRRGKGMVLDPDDLDTRSAGSFFTNPILQPIAFENLRAQASADPPAWPEPDGRIKTSAAWLIERAGFTKGYGDPAGIAISAKHVLAITNRGAGTTAQLITLAREIADRVEARFGVTLVPEPVFVGAPW